MRCVRGQFHPCPPKSRYAWTGEKTGTTSGRGGLKTRAGCKTGEAEGRYIIGGLRSVEYSPAVPQHCTVQSVWMWVSPHIDPPSLLCLIASKRYWCMFRGRGLYVDWDGYNAHGQNPHGKYEKHWQRRTHRAVPRQKKQKATPRFWKASESRQKIMYGKTKNTKTRTTATDGKHTEV